MTSIRETAEYTRAVSIYASLVGYFSHEVASSVVSTDYVRALFHDRSKAAHWDAECGYLCDQHGAPFMRSRNPLRGI